jgi:rhamnogalacturonyl hydrolase YesR
VITRWRQFLSGSASFGGGGSRADAAGPDAPDEVTYRIERATAAAMAMQRRDWEQGILAQALLEAGDWQRLIRLAKGAIVQNVPDGRIAVVVAGGPTDPAMGGEAYWRAAERTDDEGMKEAVLRLLGYLRQGAPRSSDGILYHVFDGPEMWSDGFNCAPPFFSSVGLYDEALAQIDGYWRRLWDPDRRLLAHIWDDGARRLKRAEFWGVGNGWAAAGLTQVIRSLPPGRDEDRARLAAMAMELVDGCLAWQRADGLFHNVIDRPETFVETNLAQMLAFAIYDGIAGGWLPASYRAAADRMRAAARAKMDNLGYVHGVCGAPNFDRPGIATEGQAFCILMESAGRKLA